METLVATVLIVIVFMVASMVLNSLFVGSFLHNENQVREELLQLQYQYQYGKLEIPYNDEVGAWNIAVKKEDWDTFNNIIFSASHNESNAKITFEVLDELD
ncbi:hypothetical protein HME9304_02729 [Flagellimonas maritima]|uniref:Type II secretion system protein n=1 Tax=Flagellimonas maritima TaxID=1383885 RepID=A0A2Z4LVB9_9FLAO|nr:hypothetical protein [Allomuricauda aurantiaca]AWX45702.1 hypothetical protein HME9304_02729 [Allomuricauda aurantiaca]